MFSIAIAEAVWLGSGKGFATLRPHSSFLFFEALPEDIAVRSNGERKDEKPDRKAKKVRRRKLWRRPLLQPFRHLP
jgi:hypothetical protein